MSQQPENCENRNDPDLVQAFLKKWWVESDFKAPKLPLSLRLKGSGCHYNSIYNNKMISSSGIWQWKHSKRGRNTEKQFGWIRQEMWKQNQTKRTKDGEIHMNTKTPKKLNKHTILKGGYIKHVIYLKNSHTFDYLFLSVQKQFLYKY